MTLIPPSSEPLSDLSETTPLDSKKLVPDSGGGESIAITTPYGNPRNWGYGDLMANPLKIASNSKGLWTQITVIAAAILAVPGFNFLLQPVLFGMITMETENAVHGRPSPSLPALWGQVQPRLPALYWTSFCLLFLVFGGILSFGAFIGLINVVLGSLAATLVGISGGIVGFVWILKSTFFALQIATLESTSGWDAIRACREAIDRSRQELLGGGAIGIFLTFQFLARFTNKVVTTLLKLTILPMIVLIHPLLGFAVSCAALGLCLAPIAVYRTSSWTTLYLRGR